MKRIVFILCLMPLPVVVSGCIAAAVGAGVLAGVAFVAGDLEATLEAPLDRVYQASLEAVDQGGYPIVDQTLGEERARITALQTGEEERITIRLTSVAPNATKVDIRVGAYGDEDLSRRILDRIQRNL